MERGKEVMKGPSCRTGSPRPEEGFLTSQTPLGMTVCVMAPKGAGIKASAIRADKSSRNPPRSNDGADMDLLKRGRDGEMRTPVPRVGCAGF